MRREGEPHRPPLVLEAAAVKRERPSAVLVHAQEHAQHATGVPPPAGPASRSDVLAPATDREDDGLHLALVAGLRRVVTCGPRRPDRFCGAPLLGLRRRRTFRGSGTTLIPFRGRRRIRAGAGRPEPVGDPPRSSGGDRIGHEPEHAEHRPADREHDPEDPGRLARDLRPAPPDGLQGSAIGPDHHRERRGEKHADGGIPKERPRHRSKAMTLRVGPHGLPDGPAAYPAPASSTVAPRARPRGEPSPRPTPRRRPAPPGARPRPGRHT